MGEAVVRHHYCHLLARHADSHIRIEEGGKGRGGEELLGFHPQHPGKQSHRRHQVYSQQKLWTLPCHCLLRWLSQSSHGGRPAKTEGMGLAL